MLLPRGGWAAEQAEVAYAKGIVEYGKGDYLEALEHFRIAVDLAPEDANARFYLGLTQNRLGEFSAAIPHFEQALRLDASLQHVHYPLALAYFQEERYAEALTHLQRAVQFDPQHAAAQFYLGSTLYQLKQYRESLPHFERTLQLDPSLALTAQYYRGLALFELERDAEARQAFEAARAADPESTIGQNAQRYLEILKSREREQRIWQVEGHVNLQYDDNVILEPNDVAIGSQADGRVILRVVGRVFPLRTPQWHIGAEYDFFQSLHFTLHDFDIRGHTFELFGRLKLQPVTLRLAANYTLTDLDNSRYAESFTVRPSATVQQTDTLFAIVTLQISPEQFFTDVAPGQDPAVRSRDGWRVRGGLDQYWLFNNKRAYARLGYHYETQSSEGSDWDYHSHEVSLGVQTPLWAGLTLDVNGTYNRFTYQHVNSFSCCLDARGGLGILDANDTRKRTDNRWTASIALSRDVGPFFTVSAGYTHVSNVSNLAFFDYRRNIVTLAISGRY
ncbi:MAG: tetratricopeptide repeat protein [candidate division KSB1 bacterium]|nr:tetratricopeptide repeat protein [candidate division KSB1 bacterium]